MYIGDEVVLCFMFFGLTLGAFVTYVLNRFAPTLPYTVIIFGLGILLAIGMDHIYFEHLGTSIRRWSLIEPNLLLFSFIPALIFGEAMSLNIHHCRKTFLSSYILAFPGSVLGTFLLAACVKVMLPYNWSWNLCYALGAILCATDPVAVVALLKQVGISSRFTMLITQEALWNDGIALVLFEIFLDALRFENEHDFSAVGIVKYFILVIFVSPLIGFAFGLATVFAMSFCDRRSSAEHSIVQFALAISCGYLSFFVAQSALFVSGIISCVCAGMVVAWIGNPLILNHENMHSVWSSIEWVGNTLLFLLAGIILGANTHRIESIDIVSIIVVYLLLQIIRIAMIFCFYPLLKNFGYGITLKEIAFLSWSGLRGAIGMALALVIEQAAERKTLDIGENVGSKVLFIVGGVTTLTLTINAVSAQSVLNALGLVDNSKEIQAMQHYARKRVSKKMNCLLVNLSLQLSQHDSKFLDDFRETIQGLDRDQGTVKRHRSVATSKTTLIKYMRNAFLDMVRSVYWRNIKDGKLPRNSTAAALLLYSVELGQDFTQTEGFRDWDAIEQSLSPDRYSWIVNFCSGIDSALELVVLFFGFCCRYSTEKSGEQQTSCCSRKGLLQKASCEYFEWYRLEKSVIMLSNYIEAHEYAQRTISNYLDEEDIVDAQEEALVVLESKAVVKKAEDLFKMVDEEVIKYHVSKQITRVVLNTQETMIENLLEEGFLNPRDADVLIRETLKTSAMVESEGVNKLLDKFGLSYLSFASVISNRPSELSMNTFNKTPAVISPMISMTSENIHKDGGVEMGNS